MSSHDVTSSTQLTNAPPPSTSSLFQIFATFLSIHFSPVIVIGLLSFLSSFYLGLLTFGDSLTFYLMLNVLKTFMPSFVNFSRILPPLPMNPNESVESHRSREEAEEFKFVVLLLSIRGLFNSVAMVRLAWKEARWDFLKWCAPVLTLSTCLGVFILDHYGESSWLHPLLGTMLGGAGVTCLILRLRKQYCLKNNNGPVLVNVTAAAASQQADSVSVVEMQSNSHNYHHHQETVPNSVKSKLSDEIAVTNSNKNTSCVDITLEPPSDESQSYQDTKYYSELDLGHQREKNVTSVSENHLHSHHHQYQYNDDEAESLGRGGNTSTSFASLEHHQKYQNQNQHSTNLYYISQRSLADTASDHNLSNTHSNQAGVMHEKNVSSPTSLFIHQSNINNNPNTKTPITDGVVVASATSVTTSELAPRKSTPVIEMNNNNNQSFPKSSSPKQLDENGEENFSSSAFGSPTTLIGGGASNMNLLEGDGNDDENENKSAFPNTTPTTQQQQQHSETAVLSQLDEDADSRRKLQNPLYMDKARFFFVLSCIPSGITGGICDVTSIGLIVVVTAMEFPKSLARGTLPLCFLWVLIIRFIYTFFAGEFIVTSAWPETLSMIGFGVMGTATGNLVGRVVNNEQFLMAVVVMMIVGGLSLGEAPFWIVGTAFTVGTVWVGRTFFENQGQLNFLVSSISNAISQLLGNKKKQEKFTK